MYKLNQTIGNWMPQFGKLTAEDVDRKIQAAEKEKDKCSSSLATAQENTSQLANYITNLQQYQKSCQRDRLFKNVIHTLNDGVDWTSRTIRWLIRTTIVALITGLSYELWQYYTNEENVAYRNIPHSEIPLSPNRRKELESYVPRPEIDAYLEHILISNPEAAAYFIVGEKTVGKSTSMEKALLGKKGVIYVQVGLSDSAIGDKIMSTMGITGSHKSNLRTLANFQVSIKLLYYCSWLPEGLERKVLVGGPS